jgi:hypothetical protein
MRIALALAPLLSLLLPFAGGSLLVAADAPAHEGHVKAVNTICPNEGDAVDSSIPPVVVTTKEGKTVAIGVCCKDCPPIVKKDPDKFAAAALANKKAAK